MTKNKHAVSPESIQTLKLMVDRFKGLAQAASARRNKIEADLDAKPAIHPLESSARIKRLASAETSSVKYLYYVRALEDALKAISPEPDIFSDIEETTHGRQEAQGAEATQGSEGVPAVQPAGSGDGAADAGAGVIAGEEEPLPPATAGGESREEGPQADGDGEPETGCFLDDRDPDARDGSAI